jgi:excisionase family DNA binding protein
MNLTFEQLPTAVSQLSKQLENIERLLQQQNNQQQNQPDKLLTIQQAAELLNLTVPTIYGKVSKGELPHMKRSKRLYFSTLELMDYLKAGKKKTYAETALEADEYLANKKRR